ncbi:MAG: prolipoprotein diacylglyceryl transferase [Acidimicrobiia bacterium]|nr:prolipoprotein diacylglyceryl transferase [Acidimicrobiia bacterium]
MLSAISYPPIPIWEVGPFRLSLHGVFAALGFIAGAWLATKFIREKGLDAQKYQSVLSWGLVGALIGARYFTAPAALIDGGGWAVLHPLQGNFSIMGGFLGGILAGWWKMRAVDLARVPAFDASSFGLALGTIVGRIGDLAIVEHLGKATTVPWGYGIKPGYDVAPQHNGLECATVGADGLCGTYHHVAAYDLIGATILLGVLYLLYRSFDVKPGQMISFWVIWYGLQRFILDFMRIGNGDATLGPITWNQASGLAAALLGVGMFVWFGRHKVEAEAVPVE